MSNELLLWISFHTFILIMLALDIGVFHKKAHVISVKEALWWSAFWIGLACLFGVGIWFYKSNVQATEFVTAYVIEKSLSVDNLFVFLAIFSYFKVPEKYQHKVLFWGVLGALIMRALFIIGGVAILAEFHSIIYILGAFLVFTGFKLIFSKDDVEFNPESSWTLKLVRRFFGVSKNYHEDKFIVRKMGYTFVTPLFMVLALVETTDLVFALDSIPAVLAVSPDPFIVYTSNIFAILGLRSLYFALAGVVGLFHYLNYGLAVILSFIGVKMIISGIYKIPIELALFFVLVILLASVVISLLFPKKSNSESPV
ncbi:MAG: TerC family protein [Ignavibacteria bacterium]|nr:TerC family protein [Ignavibacteria bacterium]